MYRRSESMYTAYGDLIVSELGTLQAGQPCFDDLYC
ncbi:hypothetical protein OIU77_023377 [Salix suchowensis]|uniref:Uncharacterized protein n=1 Tax=Salix suchowensis TaxID=1278906 RepID=A0ABQ9C6N7_9ROSI|nr:hypothetical protein OIU77_023377 [Salix suchowensis]